MVVALSLAAGAAFTFLTAYKLAGSLWIAADGGLSRLKNSRLATMNSRNGLPCDAVGWVVEDTAHSLWLGMACGDSEVLAKTLGAAVYIDSGSANAAEALQREGGAQVILATAPSSKAMSEAIDGLAPNGRLLVIGVAAEPIQVTPVQLITKVRAIQGWAAGTPADSEDTLRFAELSGVRPMVETYPLERAAEAYARMMSGKARFRVVLTM